MSRLALLLSMVVGCYSPAAHPGSPCDPGACPSGLVCTSNVCVEPVGDAARDSPALDSRGVDAAVLAPFKTPPTPIPGVNSSANEDDPTLTADRLTIMFTRDSAAAGTELWMGTRSTTNGAFTVAIVTELNSAADEQSPELSADGLTVYFTSTTSGSGEVYRSTRTAGQPWAAPIVSSLSSAAADGDVAVSPDGLTAIVARFGTNTQTLWRYTRASTSGPFSNPIELTALEISGDIAAPTLTNGAQTVYFHSGLVRDLYVSRLVGGVYTTPAPVTELNTASRDASPFINATDDRIAFQHDGDLYEAAR